MSIQRLHIRGFKSLKDVTWQPGKLNVVIGPNGSGKSNLLLFFRLLSAAAEGGLAQTIQDNGGASALLWDRRCVDFDSDLSLVGVHSSFQYYMDIAQAKDGDSMVVFKERLEDNAKVNEEKTKKITYLSRENVQAVLLRTDDTERLVELVNIPDQELLLSFITGPFEADEKIKLVRSYLASWFIGANLVTDGNSLMRQPSVTRYVPHMSPNGDNLVSVLHTLYTGDRDFKRNLDAGMTAAFGLDYKELIFPPAGSQKIELQIRWNSLRYEQSALGFSDGTLRFLYLISILADPNPPPLIAIDEPETGLHPRMLPIIAEYAAEASKKTQVIFTTHSPQFLDAFRDMKPTTTVATWEDGQTKLATLDGNELDYWLREYTLGSLFTSGELDNMAADIREKQMQGQA